MRSSKSRSRSKSNRGRTVGGNVVNRVFDSSGPEGKVRGTPQQIIEKYNQLARDAQLAGDRVAAENFQQHAEHYLRLLSSAQKEQEARREEQERQNRERQAERDRERARRQERELNGGELVPERPAAPEPAAVVDAGEDVDSGLVETPESRGRGAPDAPAPDKAAERPAEKPADKPKRSRKPRAPKPQARSEGGAPDSTPGDDGGPGPQEAAE